MSDSALKLIRAQGDQPHQLYIFDEIGFWGYDRDLFLRDLSGLSGEPLDVHIASLGGSVHDGIAIYNALLDYKGQVTTYADSIAASIASVIFMAGDKRVIADNGSLMTHKPMAGFVGNSDEVDSFKAELEFFNEVIAKSYTRSGLEGDDLQSLINQGDRWIDASEALDLGLATDIKEGLRAVASLDLNKLENKPDFVVDNHVKKQGLLDKFLKPSAKSQKPLNQGAEPPEQVEEVIMTTETIAKPEHEAALASAVADATAQAQKDATDRIVAIHALDSAKGKDTLVAKLVANVNLTVDEVDDILQATPAVKTVAPPVDEIDGLDLDNADDGNSTDRIAQFRSNIGKGK